VRDALIDTYGCMLIGAGQAVARKTHQALINGGQINDYARACIYATHYYATPGAAAMAKAVAGHALESIKSMAAGGEHSCAVDSATRYVQRGKFTQLISVLVEFSKLSPSLWRKKCHQIVKT
jgi:hypothetical protein